MSYGVLIIHFATLVWVECLGSIRTLISISSSMSVSLGSTFFPVSAIIERENIEMQIIFNAPYACILHSLYSFFLLLMNSDDHQLRALELNSWQLFRLVEAQISGLSCGSIPLNGFRDTQISGTTECIGSIEKILCCLYMNAAVLHCSWKFKKVSESVIFMCF